MGGGCRKDLIEKMIDTVFEYPEGGEAVSLAGNLG